jgi:aminopeptidase N
MRNVWACIVAAGVLVAVGLPAAGAVPTAARAASTIGSGGGGDRYYPHQGNGGYDVSHYRLSIRYYLSGHRLFGVARIQARATQNLTRFELDLRRSLTATAVTVNGRAAAFGQPGRAGQRLVIRPVTELRAGQRFTVLVRYHGVGKPLRDPNGSLDGWIPTNDGAIVASEPQGSPTWFPVNDTPRDKATYRVSINVPRRLQAIGNGALQSRVTSGSRTTWTWQIFRPIPSYLVTAAIGHYRITRGHTAKGIPYLVAVDPSQRAGWARVRADLPRIVDYFSAKYGRYPFGQTGAIVDNAPYLGYALETATRPLFDRAPSELTLAHELAHQWFGDDVTLKRWRDIWLNEGFAEFSSWLWVEHDGGQSAAARMRYLLANASDWNPPPANPGDAAHVFAGSVYDRGACALQALREKLGGHTFIRILRGWVAAHRFGNATVPQFVSYAERISHRDLGRFFYRWLYRPGKP